MNKLKFENTLLCLLSDETVEIQPKIEEFKQIFCGRHHVEPQLVENCANNNLYICGDMKHRPNIDKQQHYFIIRELSCNYNESDNDRLVSLDRVPIHVHGLGMFVKHCFDESKNYFQLVTNNHDFQTLTLSKKGSNALRKGIYLSEVEEDHNQCRTFHLLRCSTNLDGPTESFSETDREIIETVQSVSNNCFTHPFKLNHVLAQVYTNGSNGSNHKARIAAHSDKTKDMDPNGTIAFCTFYDRPVDDKNSNELTKLCFKLKKDRVHDANLPEEFTVTLYDRSMFIIPLLTNQLYTHEIKPSFLPIEKLPTRLGYVIRCSNTLAYSDGRNTFVQKKKDGTWEAMRVMNAEDEKELQELYVRENKSSEPMIYPPDILYSMNQGDYQNPIIVGVEALKKSF